VRENKNMATIRDLIKKFTKGSKNTYNKVLDTEVSDIANTSKKVSKGIFGFIIDFYAVVLYGILGLLVYYMGFSLYTLFT
tara:strand:+ start:1515 stop:1754 length:240 start_codon:yes stop_codon:yes gene_type:complete